MMKDKLFDYVSRRNLVYDLSGVTKLICFLLSTMAVMFSYDIRVIAVVMIFSFIMLFISQIRFAQIRGMLVYVLIFLLLNAALTFLFDPQYGVELYGTKHELVRLFGRYVLTEEQLLYQCTKTLKYASVVPLGILFFLTTHPSELAASINRIGVPYKAAFTLSLTLRYFPDIIRTYQDISLAQQSRGLDLSKKEKVFTRVKNIMNICIPLIFSTLTRVDIIANTMDLRGFGKKKRRTWYSFKPLVWKDWVAIGVCLLLLAGSIAVNTFINHSKYFNPFIS